MMSRTDSVALAVLAALTAAFFLGGVFLGG